MRPVEDRTELRAKIEAHPWRSVGLAALAGALVGVGAPGARSSRQAEGWSMSRWIGDALLAVVSAMVVRTLREAAIGHLGDIARHWFDTSEAAPEAPGRPPYASRDRGRA